MNHLLSLATVGAFLLAGTLQDPSRKPLSKSLAGGPMPELESSGGTWLNAREAVKVAELRGKVVLLMFTVLW